MPNGGTGGPAGQDPICAEIAPVEPVPGGQGDDPSGGAEHGVELQLGSADNVIPRPTTTTAGQGHFVLDDETVILVGHPVSTTAACLLRDELARVTGFDLSVRATDHGPGVDVEEPGAGSISFATREAAPSSAYAPSPGVRVDEGYELVVTEAGVTIVASTVQGHLWGMQTLLQLGPPQLSGPSQVDSPLAFAAVEITDEPRYEWRGLMLDLARHYFEPSEVKRVIDLMGAYKLNVLHLHLTDDQGWRIAIDAYPELTEIGANNEVGGGAGGHLTKQDYVALVEYARRRGITVVPEVDMPGHTNAALASLPELNCDGRRSEPYTGTQVGFSTLCIGEPAVDEFVTTVLTELAELTPGPYLHIGGDESRSTAPADFERFVDDTARVVADLDKVVVGWEEIGRVDIGSEVVVQHWLDAATARAAAANGASVVLSPSSRLYFDMNYGEFAPAGNSWAGSIDTRHVYDWDPATEFSSLPQGQVLGVEAPLWSELVRTADEIDQRLLPRLPALAELSWTQPQGRDWDDFAARVATHASRWAAASRPFTEDPAIPW